MGGSLYMAPITIMFFVAVGLAVLAALQIKRNAPVAAKRLELMKQVGILSAAWGTFSTIIGFAQAFRSIEMSETLIPFEVIAGGLWVGLITVLYGLLVYCIVQFVYICLLALLKPADR